MTEAFNESKFAMWRCIIGMAHADGILHEDEQAYLTKMFDNMRDRAGMPADMHDTLVDDLHNPKDVEPFMGQIVDPAFRSQLVYFARLLAYKDGEKHPDEAQLLKIMKAEMSGGVDMDAIRAEVRANVASEVTLHELKRDSLGPGKSGLFALIHELALKFNIDLMD